MERLDGKVAVVTGAASGIGRAIAERFVKERMRVLLADVEEMRLRATADALRSTGADVVAVPTDVTDASAVQQLANAALERFGVYHVICNNAGVPGHTGPVWQTPLADWRWVFDVNVWGTIHGIRSFVPRLIEQREGHVVNMAALVSWLTVPTLGPYAASKHAVLAISETLRAELELAEANVGVSVVCPGAVTNTEILSAGRNWPAALGDEPEAAGDRMTTRVRQRPHNDAVEPSAVAETVIDGIRHNRFVVTTHVASVAAAAAKRLSAVPGQ